MMSMECEHLLIGNFSDEGLALCQECNKEVSYTDMQVVLVKRIAALEAKSARQTESFEAQWHLHREATAVRDTRIAALEADSHASLIYAASWEKERVNYEARISELEAALARANNLISDFIDDDDTPDANCSCHINPPCGDCVNHGWRRELIDRAKVMRPMREE